MSYVFYDTLSKVLSVRIVPWRWTGHLFISEGRVSETMGFCPLWILIFEGSETRSIGRRKRFRINQEDKC